MICSAFANSVDPDQLASEEANWSGSALFVVEYVNSYQQHEPSNLIDWKLEVGMAFLIFSAWQGLISVPQSLSIEDLDWFASSMNPYQGFYSLLYIGLILQNCR